MKKRLKDIASIQTGTYAQTEINGDIIYLQAKHFNENGNLKSKLHPEILRESISEKHILKPGNVLFAAKGTKNFATLFEEKNEPAIASTSFFVIRLKNFTNDLVLPEYLVWFLNHPKTQSHLKGNAIGTSIVSISKYVLSDLEISIPDLKTQNYIVNIAALQMKEKDLIQKLQNLRESQIQQLILNAIN
ncbi:MAG TPA: restriction endonuclease subunit S [Ignavibacteria bacterium]|nr:restriction endonuclease subunit S [Ignavibacteria bacterium]HMR41192.1 restriction endonuclease subunit S [Ignavibacteria bacterium]